MDESEDRDVIGYVKLIDEQVEVWRPTRLRPLAAGVYEMLEEAPYGESWEFESPARVQCEVREIIGGHRLVVTGLAAS